MAPSIPVLQSSEVRNELYSAGNLALRMSTKQHCHLPPVILHMRVSHLSYNAQYLLFVNNVLAMQKKVNHFKT